MKKRLLWPAEIINDDTSDEIIIPPVYAADDVEALEILNKQYLTPVNYSILVGEPIETD
jgi:hypothetical protein